jgi:hypothetical protein
MHKEEAPKKPLTVEEKAHMEAYEAKRGKTAFIYAILFAVLAGLLSFDFGGPASANYLGAIGFLLAAFYIVFTDYKPDKKDLKEYAIYLIPFFIFMVLICFNRFGASLSSNFAIQGLLALFVMLSFLAAGFVFRGNKAYKNEYLAYAIVAGLSLAVLVCLINGLAVYGPMHALSGEEYYYNGIPYRVGDEAGLLIGFGIAQVSTDFASQFAFLLGACLSFLFYLDPRKKLVPFILIACGSFLGLLYLILQPNYIALILEAALYVFFLLLRFFKPEEGKRRWVGIVGWVLFALIILYLVLLLSFGAFGFDYGSASRLTNLVFNNRVVYGPNRIISLVFRKGGGVGAGAIDWLSAFFGADALNSYGTSGYSTYYVADITNHVFEFDALLEGGIICFIALVAFIFMSILDIRRYLKRAERLDFEHMIPVVFLAAWFLYSSLQSDHLPYAHDSTYVYFFLQNGPWLIALFLLAYIHEPRAKKKAVAEEPKPVVKEPEMAAEDVEYDD